MDAESEFEKKAREGMNDDEAQFSVEVPLTAQAFLWSDKYRPRKPRFFNRVHTVCVFFKIFNNTIANNVVVKSIYSGPSWS